MKNIREIVRGSNYVCFDFMNKRYSGELSFIENYFQFSKDIKDRHGNVLTGGVGVASHNDIAGRDAPDTHPLASITGLDSTGTGSLFLADDGTYKSVGSASGDMTKAVYDVDGNGVVDNSELVSGYSVGANVPVGAVFTDTVYDDTSIQAEVDLNTTHRSSTANPHSVNASQVAVTDSDNYFLGTTVEAVLSEIGETRAENGWDLLQPDTMADIAFDFSTRTFSTSVKSGQGSYMFWCDSKKFIKSVTETVIIPNVTGTYYIYFNNSGNLQYVVLDSIQPELFYEYAITGLVYWNAETSTGIVGNEQHGKLMDARTHHSKHSTLGALYEADGGMDITGLTNGGATFTNITSGYFWDEDIRHTVALQTTAPFIYRYGTAGAWRSTAATNAIAHTEGGSYYVWNEWTGTTWQLTEGTSSSDYWIIFTIATPDITGYQIKKIIGQNAYSNKRSARSALDTEISKITTDGLPSPEFVFLHAWIAKRDGTLVDDGEGNTYIDLRSTKGGVGSTSGVTGLDLF